MFFFALFVPLAANTCLQKCSLMYYLDSETCTCIRCGTGNCKGGEWYLPQVCETENSEDSGCRTCGEEHCAEDDDYMKQKCSATSSGCITPEVENSTSCQYRCGYFTSKCFCDHICSEFDDCCRDFQDWCIWGHNCPTVEPMDLGSPESICPIQLDILEHDNWGNHTQCSDSTLEVGDWCESDGECGYSEDLNNCMNSGDIERPLDLYIVISKAISSCVDDGTITCGPGEYIDTERYCNGTECTDLDIQCCNIPGQCLNASYVTCPYHQFWEVDNGVTCATKRCQADECCADSAGCEEAEGLFTCPGHKFLDTTAYCSDDVCDSSDIQCCTNREYCNNTNLTCVDEENYFLDFDIPDLCAERCTDPECCVERLSCANNTVLTCNYTTFLDPRLNCATDECLITDTQCCEDSANCDESVVCPEDAFSDPNYFCATDVCAQTDESICCQHKAHCIDDGTIICDSAFFIDTDSHCAVGICESTDTQCCVPRSSCDDTVECSYGEFSDPSILCATDICKASETHCCQPQASCNKDADCGPGTYFNESFYCSTDTCTAEDTQCCEQCIESNDEYPVEGVCPNAVAPKDGSGNVCEHLDLDVQHRFEKAISNQLWNNCHSWCIYDLYNNGDVAFIWKPNLGDNGCYIETTWATCFEGDERARVLDKMRLFCSPEPYDACAPLDLENDCLMVWDAEPVENPIAFNRLIYCHCPRPLFWGFRDWRASTAVLCNDEGNGLDTRLHLALANHGFGSCYNWCIFDVWEPETYAWIWDMHNRCYHQRYIDEDKLTVCSDIWGGSQELELNKIKSYTDRFCDAKDIEWTLGPSGQSCSKACGLLDRSCDGEIAAAVNYSLTEGEIAEYFSYVGITCADFLEGDHPISGGTGYYTESGNCVVTSSLSGFSHRDYCEVSPTVPTFQRLCACVRAPNEPSPF